MRQSCDCHVIMLVQVFLVAVANTICGDLLFWNFVKNKHFTLAHLQTHTHIHTSGRRLYICVLRVLFVCHSQLQVETESPST